MSLVEVREAIFSNTLWLYPYTKALFHATRAWRVMRDAALEAWNDLQEAPSVEKSAKYDAYTEMRDWLAVQMAIAEGRYNAIRFHNSFIIALHLAEAGFSDHSIRAHAVDGDNEIDAEAIRALGLGDILR